jgi:hypothetical protein
MTRQEKTLLNRRFVLFPWQTHHHEHHEHHERWAHLCFGEAKICPLGRGHLRQKNEAPGSDRRLRWLWMGTAQGMDVVLAFYVFQKYIFAPPARTCTRDIQIFDTESLVGCPSIPATGVGRVNKLLGGTPACQSRSATMAHLDERSSFSECSKMRWTIWSHTPIEGRRMWNVEEKLRVYHLQ